MLRATTIMKEAQTWQEKLKKDRIGSQYFISFHQCLVFFFLFFCQNVVEVGAELVSFNPSKIPLQLHQDILKLSGGQQFNNQDNNNNNVYQMKPMTIGDLDNNSYSQHEVSLYSSTASSHHNSNYNNNMQNGFSTTSSRTKLPPLTQIITSYIQKLHAKSPTLSVVTTSSIVVFFLWQCTSIWSHKRKNHLLSFLRNHFVCSKHTILQKRYVDAAFLASISHISFTHLVFNLYVFLSLGKQLLSIISPLPIWPIVMGSSLLGSLSFISLTSPNHSNNSGGCLGLSGVTSSFLSIYALRYPTNILHMRLPWPLWALFPDATIQLAAIHVLQLFGGVTLLCVILPWIRGSLSNGSSRSSNKNIAHATHLGGLVFGWIYVESWKRGYLRKITYSTWGGRSFVWKKVVKVRSTIGSIPNSRFNLYKQ